MNNKRQIVKRKVESATEDVGRDLWKTRKSVARSQTKKKKKKKFNWKKLIG